MPVQIQRPPGIDVSVNNPNKELYIGNEFTDGSFRFQIVAFDSTFVVEIQERIEGLWQPASFKTGPQSVIVGTLVSLSAAGSHIITTDTAGGANFIPRSSVAGGLTTRLANIIHASEFFEESEFRTDVSSEFIGTSVERADINDVVHLITQKFYFKTGSTAATSPVRIQSWEGTDDTGTLLFDQFYPASDFPANTSIGLDLDGFLEFALGAETFTRISSDADFSLKGGADPTDWALSVDFSIVQDDDLLQTTEYIDGDNFDRGQWTTQDRKVYVCNVTGTQAGGFSANLDKWDVLTSILFAEANPTGLIDGGEVNIGPGVNDVEILEGFGVVIDSYTVPDAVPTHAVVAWDQINEPITAAPATAGSVVFLTIFNTLVPDTPVNNIPVFVGALRQYDALPTPSVLRDELLLGAVLHDGDDWGDVSFPKVINNTAESLWDVMTSVVGPLIIIDGGGVSEAPLYTLDQAEGTIWQLNRNWQNDHKDPHREPIPQTTGIQWKYTNRDFSDVTALTGTVDDATYDNDGTVEAIPGGGNAATIQRLYLDPDSNFWVLWGQEVFDNAQEAASRINSPIEVPQLLASSFLLGYIVTEKGKTDWDPDESFFIQGGSAGTGAPAVPITNHNDLLLRDAANTHPLESLVDMELVTPPFEVGDGIVWTGSKWEALKLWVAAGYGGITQETPTGIGDIGGGILNWETLVADTISTAVPRGVDQLLATNALSLNAAGVWSVSVSFSISHNEVNSSRQFSIRIFDITSASAGKATLIGIGRNSGVTTFATTFLLDITPGQTGDDWRIEVGGTADNITGVDENSYAFNANLVSEFRG